MVGRGCSSSRDYRAPDLGGQSLCSVYEKWHKVLLENRIPLERSCDKRSESDSGPGALSTSDFNPSIRQSATPSLRHSVSSVRQCDNYLRNELNNLYFPPRVTASSMFFPLAATRAVVEEEEGQVRGAAQLVACFEKFIQHCGSRLRSQFRSMALHYS